MFSSPSKATRNSEVSWYNDQQLAELFAPLAEKCFLGEPSLKKLTDELILQESTAGEDADMMSLMPMMLDVLDNYCDSHETTQFEKALKDFQKCSNIDMKAYYETFADSIVGVTLSCARYFVDLVPSVMMSIAAAAGYYGNGSGASGLFPLPRVPDQCLDTFMGDNPLGNTIRNGLEHPGLDVKCYKALSEDVPSCTLKQWPIPIPGTVVKVSSCVNSEMLPEIESTCDAQFSLLNECLDDPRLTLPPQKQNDETCAKWISKCGNAGSTFVAMPAPLNALPLSDVCQERIEIHPEAAKLFEAFQKSCIAEDDMKYWKSGGGGAASLSSFHKYNQGGGGGGSGFGIFFMGLLTGGAALGAAVYVKKKRMNETFYNQVELNKNVELA